MKLLSLLFLTAAAAASAVGTNVLTADNYYGYDFHPKPVHTSPVPFTSGLYQRLKSWAEKFPSLKNLIQTQTNELPAPLRAVTDNGYSHYSQSASMQAVESVDAGSFDAFASFLTDSLEIPAGRRAGFLESMQIIKFADNTDWNMIDMIFDQSNGLNCKYVCVLGHRNADLGTYDFMVADFKSSFKLAPNIVLIEERKSYLWGLVQTANIRVVEVPATLKLEHVELLKTFFSQAALARFAKMLGVTVPGLEQAYLDPVSIMGIISAGVQLIPQIINAFKTTITSTIIKEIAGDGFTHYEQSSVTQIIQGITDDNVRNHLMRMLPTLLKLTGTVFEGVKLAVELGMYTESNVWTDYKIVYNQDDVSRNEVQFCDVVCSNRGDGKFDLVLVSVQQKFRLAPNVQYIEHAKSYVGGIYSETKIERKEYPRSLTEADMKVLTSFFHITVFKRLANQYNIQMPALPDKPPLKP